MALVSWFPEGKSVHMSLPGSPEATAAWSLLFTADLAGWRAELRNNTSALLHGRLHGEEVAEQSSLGLSVDLTLRQEVDGLLHTPAVTFTSLDGAARLLMGLFLLLSQEINCHLQDIGFLLSGIRLLL